MNKTIKLLMISDIFVITGFGLIAPILSIFIKDNVVGGTIFTAGVASTIFFLVKSVLQLPFSKYVDSHDDKVKWLILGTFLVTSVPFIYTFSNHIYYIYLAQIIYGVGSALAFPTWLSLWSTHLDNKHEGFEWSLYSTLTGLGMAATASIGAAIAEFVGFQLTFMFVGAMAFAGCLILFNLEKKAEKARKGNIRYRSKKNKFV